ncbi:TonB family protein [Myxococcota bacterium]|nr:TonB family protein [Myxococcota bacterium]MBU1379966.1 TonB family protein [Myxococcota bacterium]MBU1497753.1 TonB family protein [Myxococcota bacterium]
MKKLLVLAWVLMSFVPDALANPDTAELKKVVTPPKTIKTVSAVFPPEGYTPAGGIEVVLKITVKADGTVSDITIVKSGGDLFDKAAETAVMQWTFEPAMFEGKKIAVKITVPFKFPERLKPADPKGGKNGDVVKPGKDGKNGDVVKPGKDGKNGDVVKPGKDGKNGDVVKPGKDGKNGDVVKPGKDGKGDGKTPAVKPDGKNANKPQGKDPHEGHDHGTYHDHGKKLKTDIVVTGVLKKQKTTSNAEFQISGKVLQITTKKSGGDMLTVAPGLYIGHPQGEGIANTIFLRGFNAEHGQDFEIKAGFIPVNLPGHIHAQGYADMHFIMPEIVDSITVIEGVYDVTQGDFAVAGSAIFNYGVRRRGTNLFLTLGSYNTMKLGLVFAPRGQARDTFAAAQFSETDGYGDGNRASLSAKAMGRYHFCIDEKTHIIMHIGGYGGRSVLPGILRLDDIRAGLVDFYGTYSYPTARAQSGFFTRFETGASLIRYLQGDGEKITFNTYIFRTDSRLRQNFTGFMLWYADQPDLKGAGDLHQQTNTATTMGGDFLYESGNTKILSLPGMFRIGMSIRSDFVDQKEDLIFPAQNMIWRHVTDAAIQMNDIGLYADMRVGVMKYLSARAGFRADALAFQINDELANRQYNVPVEQNYLLGYKRDAMGFAYGPRATIEAGPFFPYKKKGGLSIVTSYGEGFRSPPPRSLQDGERAPFAKVRSFETGVKYVPGTLGEIKVAGFYTYLSNDYVYNPVTAMTRSIGDTERYGAMISAIAKPMKNLLFSGSFTYSRGVLRSSPLATAENPTPGEKKGDLIPYIPLFVGRGDASYGRKIISFRGGDLVATAGFGYTFLGKRPLPYAQWSEPVHLLDMKVELSWKNVTFKIDISNLAGAKWHDMELNFISQWNPDVPTSLPQRHVVAGAPRLFMGTLGIVF